MQAISCSQAANTFGVGRLIRLLLEILVAGLPAQRSDEVASACTVVVWAQEWELLVVPVLVSLEAREGVQPEFSVDSSRVCCCG